MLPCQKEATITFLFLHMDLTRRLERHGPTIVGGAVLMGIHYRYCFSCHYFVTSSVEPARATAGTHIGDSAFVFGVWRRGHAGGWALSFLSLMPLHVVILVHYQPCIERQPPWFCPFIWRVAWNFSCLLPTASTVSLCSRVEPRCVCCYRVWWRGKYATYIVTSDALVLGLHFTIDDSGE